MRRKKRIRFIGKILLLIEYYTAEIEDKGVIYISLRDVKEFFCVNYNDFYFVRLLNQYFRVFELNYTRYRCGVVDGGDGIYIKKKNFDPSKLE